MKNFRYVLEYELKMENKSPLSVGTGEYYEILTDDDGNALLMGSSFAGAIKSFAEEIETDENKKMGRTEKDKNQKNKNFESQYYFSDLISDESVKLSFRDRVKINEELGTAEEKAKHRIAYVASGHNFSTKIKIFVEKENEVEKKEQFMKNVLQKINSKEIRFGSSKTNGFGCFEINNARMCRYDLYSKEGLETYITGPKKNFKLLNLEEVKSDRTEFKLYSEVANSIIVKERVSDKDKDKEVYFQNIRLEVKIKDGYEQRSIIPATSIRGVFRHHANRILNTISHGKEITNEEKQSIIKELFGTEGENEKVDAIKGNMYFEDIVIENPKEENYHRIKIDRFTGGTIKGAKFCERKTNGKIDFKIELDEKNAFKINHEDREKYVKISKALILLVMRDISLGLVSIGGGFGLGNGRLVGNKIEMNSGEIAIDVDVEGNNLRTEQKNKDKINSYLNELQKWVDRR